MAAASFPASETGPDVLAQRSGLLRPRVFDRQHRQCHAHVSCEGLIAATTQPAIPDGQARSTGSLRRNLGSTVAAIAHLPGVL